MKEPRRPEAERLQRDGITFIDPVPDPVETSIDDVQEFLALGAFCPACERETWIDRHELRRKWGNAMLVSLLPRLRCRACGNKQGNRFILGQLPR